MIKAATDPIDYLCALYGHPSTWQVDGAKVRKVEMEDREVKLHVEFDLREAGVAVIRDRHGKPFWEATVVEVTKKNKVGVICLREK